MASRSQREFFDARAPDWERRCYPAEARARLADLVLEFGLKAGDRVLDVGTGPGVLIPYLRRTIGPGGRICSFDLSLPMARQAQMKPRQPLDLVLQADVHRLPFGAGAFDAVICFAAFPHFDDPALALREMGRVAAAGARVVIAHLLSRDELARHHGGHEAVADDMLPPADAMRAFFQQAGLDVPAIEDRPGRYVAAAKKPAATARVDAGFERRAVFEKIRAADRMHHRDVRGVLLHTLRSGSWHRPRILDIGCGDAQDLAAILNDIPAAEYVGIDASREALELARVHLAQIACPWRLIHGDYAAGLDDAPGPFDLVWLGLFLHHLDSAQKRALFKSAAGRLHSSGALLTHDPVLLETEDRSGFLWRIHQASLGWPELSEDERGILSRHWAHNGRQERLSLLERMAAEEGFPRMEVLWRDPDGYYAVAGFFKR